jgi:hypothetical protein
MRGHDQLLSLRRRGLKPGLVMIDMEPDPWRDWADWHEWTVIPQIEVSPSDSIRLLDLRCLVGLRVMLSGFDGGRVWAMFDACKAAGASRVLGFHQALENGGHKVRTIEARDSAAEAVEA